MKLRKRKKRDSDSKTELGGQDSFLDLVSNIVGILIILVMVAGIRAQYSSANVTELPKNFANLETKIKELQTKEEKAIALQWGIEVLEIQQDIIADQIDLQSEEYAAVFDFMTSLRAAIEMGAAEKSQTFKEKIEYQRQLMEMNAKLEQIDKAKEYFRQVRPMATVLENIPTPLSKTVEAKEIHVRLLGGRIVHVPFDALMLQLRQHINEEKNKYFKQKKSAGKVGPVDNFEFEFLLLTLNDPARGRTWLELEYGFAVPQFEPIGQPLREALASPQSEFRRKLLAYNKDIYTVTVWVYPDSFAEYQELKKFLYDNGYTVAARPTQMGKPIGFSLYGTQSATQ